MSTKTLAPKRIFSADSHSVLIDKKDQLWYSGRIKRSSVNASEFTKIEGIKEKVKLIAIGKYNTTVVTEDNKIYRQGYSKEGHLGVNQEYTQMTVYEKVEDEEQVKETIVDLSSGAHFTLFVTESGKLYGIGNIFLKELSLDCDSKIIPIPLKEGVKVLKAYCSNSKQPTAILKVKIESTGEEQLWSAGKHEQGLLGQGLGVKSSKVFKPLKYDSAKTQFVDVSLNSDHAMAIDQNGCLWAWGCNSSKRAGVKDDIYDGIFEPIKINFHEKEGLRPL